jgi:hypothetical protein
MLFEYNPDLENTETVEIAEVGEKRRWRRPLTAIATAALRDTSPRLFTRPRSLIPPSLSSPSIHRSPSLLSFLTAAHDGLVVIVRGREHG